MEVGICGHECVFQVKTNSVLYPKAFIEDALADAPRGVHIVLEGKASNEIPLRAIGYRYSRKTTLFFVCTRNAGSTAKGAEYVMKYTDGYGNICTHLVDCPDLIAKFFASSNVIDTHNQLRQFLLALEKKWLTQNAYFHLASTYLGINVVDTYHLANNHRIINVAANDEKKMSLCTFAGILANQLITQAEQLSMEPSAQFKDDNETLPTISVTEKSPTSRLSSITSAEMEGKLITRQLEDANKQLHFLVKYELTTDPSGRKCTKARPCKLCLVEWRGRKDTMYDCILCGLKSSFCNDPNRDCF
jgi:hypothetical protein